MTKPLYGAVEAGGTKFVCAVGSGPHDLREEYRFPTTDGPDTLATAIDYFRRQMRNIPLQAIGVGAFGPLDLRRNSPRFGTVTATPKSGWRNVDVRGILQEALLLPVVIDTDVNAAAFAEHLWGAGKGLDSCLYLTVGTGIGGGVIMNRQIVHGYNHPEMGHIRIPRDAEDARRFSGNCPFHGDCLEGLASGPAIEKRWGKRAELLPPSHPAWQYQAQYLADALLNYILILAPERIILGGGVMDQAHLFTMIRQMVHERLNGYIAFPEIMAHLDSYIVPPALGTKAGVLGALALASEDRSAHADRPT